MALAFRPNGDYVPDLDGVAGDDDAVDEQFQQLSLADEVCLLETVPHAPAERFGMGSKASGLVLAAGVVHELALLAIKCQQPGFGVAPTALILVQQHHAVKIGLREPLDLLAQPRPGAMQVGPARLHFLRQPMPAAGPLHRVRDHLRGGQHLAQIAPDQLLQWSARDVARRAALARRQRGRRRRGPAHVVVVAAEHVPACAGAAATAAADQAAQEILVHPVVSRRHPLIIGQPLLRALELFAADDGRHGCNRDPLGRVRHPPAAATAAGRPQGGTSPLDGPCAQAIGEDLAEVHGVGQHSAHSRKAPEAAAPWRGDTQAVQAPRQAGNRDPLVGEPGEQVAHHRRLRLV